MLSPGLADQLSDDARLLGALRGGDDNAFQAIVRRHHASMKRVARAFVSSDAVADEVVQETWECVLRGLDRFEGRCAVKTWIFQIVVNRAKTRGWRERRSVPFSALDAEQSAGIDADAFQGPDDPSPGAWRTPPRPWCDPHRRLMSLEARAALRAAMEELPARQRAVVCLRDVEGLDCAVVSELLGVSEANQRVLLHRGRVHLRRVLATALDDGA